MDDQRALRAPRSRKRRAARHQAGPGDGGHARPDGAKPDRRRRHDSRAGFLPCRHADDATCDRGAAAEPRHSCWSADPAGSIATPSWRASRCSRNSPAELAAAGLRGAALRQTRSRPERRAARDRHAADYADDVIAAVKWLEKRKDVDKRRIAVVGHSEGGSIAMLAAVSREARSPRWCSWRPWGRAAWISSSSSSSTRSKCSRRPKASARRRSSMQKKILDAAMTGQGMEELPADIRAACRLALVPQPAAVRSGRGHASRPAADADRARGARQASPPSPRETPGRAGGHTQESATRRAHPPAVG